jgi:hypothetical protein
MRTEKTLAIEERKLALETRRLGLEDDRKRDEIAMTHQLELARLEAETGFRREQAGVEAEVVRARAMGAGEPAEGNR